MGNKPVMAGGVKKQKTECTHTWWCTLRFLWLYCFKYGSLSNVGVEKNQNNFQRVSGISRHSFNDQSKRVFFCEISGSFLHRNRCV